MLKLHCNTEKVRHTEGIEVPEDKIYYLKYEAYFRVYLNSE